MAEKAGEIYYDITLETSKLMAQSRQVGAQIGKVGAGFADLAVKMTAVASAVGLVVVATKALQMAKVADEIRMLGARVEVAAGGMKAGAEAMRELEAISIRTRSSVSANADVFSRLNQSMLQLGGTQKDTLQLTELLGKGIAASGAKGAEAESAMRQFGQAMGTGKLSGDELNSMMENSQYLMQKMAEGMGVPVGALKKLGADGKLTADVILESFGKMAAQIDDDFAKLPATIESATTVAQDASDRLSKAFDDVSGASAAMTGVMLGTGAALDALTAHLTGTADAADDLARKEAITQWANESATAISYLVQAADTVWQTISVLGRNVAFVFKGIGTEIDGIAAQIASVMRGDLSGAAAIGKAMKADAAARRTELDAADAATLGRANAGVAMRERLSKPAEANKGSAKFSKINPPKEEDKKGGKKAGSGSGDALAAAARRLALGELQNTLREEVAMIDAQQGQLDLRRQAGLMGEADYYAQKRELLVKANDLEAQALQDQIARLEKEKTSGKASLEIQQQIGALKAKLAVQQANAQNKQEALDQAASAAAAKHRAEIESLTQAHERYLAQIDKAANRSVAVVGMSSKGAQRAQGEWGIEDRYQNQERELRDRKLTAGNGWTPEDQAAFDLRIQQLQVEKQREVEVYRNTFAAIDALEADWRTGAGRSVQEYADRAGNVAQQTQDAFTNAFQGMEDALVQFAMTGKLDFKSLANSIIADIIRIQIRAAAVSFLSSAFGGGMSAAGVQSSGAVTSPVTGWGSVSGTALPSLSGFRANGGGVSAGKMYEVNERGTPELLTVGNKQLLMMAGQSGSVAPLSGGQMQVARVPTPEGRAAGAGAAPVINLTIVGAPSQPEVKQTQGANGSIDLEVIFQQIEGRLSEGIASGSSPSYRALKGRFGLQDA